MRILRVIAPALLLALLASPGVSASGLRVALLASAEVQSDTILLANLLSPSASRRMRTAAEQIGLGTAPQEGATREFTSAAITAAISSAGFSPNDFAIPAAVSVRRGSRLISRKEVFDAIESALAKNPMPGIPPLRLQDIVVEAAVSVPPGDPGLEVTQVTFDQFLRCARFRLLPAAAPGVLPFYATAKVALAFSERSSVRRFLPVAAHPPLNVPISAPVLVATGRLARLHIHSPGLDMLLEVRPLQRGHLGDVIRVRLPGTGRTLQARVVSEGYLDATL